MVTKTANSKTLKVAAAADELKYIDVSLIDPHPDNPRQKFADLDSLGASLEEHGVLQPVLLRPIAGGRYQLVAGGRRFRAAQKAGLKRIPGLVKSISDADAYLAMLVENLERRDLSPIEKARGLAQLCTPVDEGGGGLTHTAAAAKFGHSQPWATNAIRLLKLPAVWQRRIAEGEICEARARELLPFIESPNVMAAIERDFTNPSSRPFYETYRGFKRQVELLAGNHAAVSKRWRSPRTTAADGNNGTPPARPAMAPTLGHDLRPAAGPLDPPATSPAALRSSETPVASHIDTQALAVLICEQVMQLADVEELCRVEEAVRTRRRELPVA